MFYASNSSLSSWKILPDITIFSILRAAPDDTSSRDRFTACSLSVWLIRLQAGLAAS